LQNPPFQKAKGNLLHGEKMPVSGRIRGGEKEIFPEPHPASKKIATIPEDEG